MLLAIKIYVHLPSFNVNIIAYLFTSLKRTHHFSRRLLHVHINISPNAKYVRFNFTLVAATLDPEEPVLAPLLAPRIGAQL